ncbi:MAG: protein kinase [Acidobacteriota bacterium]
MIGKTFSHFEILELLGKGGMGEVYRARDTNLKRDVALKVLPADMAADPDRLERFQREAETVAGLSHPHIVTVYSVEEADGLRFLTMELVPGEGLDKMVGREGMALDKVFEIGVAVADALAAAHARGIVHRDLKPANVMVTPDGRVKVLDFGLAKLARESALTEDSATQALPLTGEGSVLGTVPYMSPEQLRGLELDHRSDIFSLGVLLYELATGKRPFSGASNADVTSSILKEAPPLVTDLKPALPRHLGRIVAHCLEKEPNRRYQSALDIRNELEGLRDEVRTGAIGQASGTVSGVSTPAPSGEHAAAGRSFSWKWVAPVAGVLIVIGSLGYLALRDEGPGEAVAPATGPSAAESGGAEASETKSIAVLPFADRSPEQDQEYFADGISEELLNTLAKVHGLRVTSRSSAFSYKGKEMRVADVAKELNVDHILEGSVRKAGDEVRITAQLIEAESDTQLWSETYDRTLEDIFAVQDEIASDVVNQLRVTLLSDRSVDHETDPEAYSLLLQARHLATQRTPEGYEKAADLFRQALEIDPNSAAALTGLGWVYDRQAGKGLIPVAEGYEKARSNANKALAIDPDYAVAHAILGRVAGSYDRDLTAAARHFEKALELDSTNPEIIVPAATLALALGRVDDNIAALEFIVERDPVNAAAHSNLGLAYIAAKRPVQAIESFRTALSLSPGLIGAHAFLARALLMQGDVEGAVAEMALEPFQGFRLIGESIAYFAAGDRAKADASLAKLIETWEREAAFNIAFVYAFRGEADKVFEWLDKAVQYQDPGLAEITSEPAFENISSDPRWLPFLESIGKSPEQLAAIEFELTLPG